ncbi:MAG: Trp family transcriptional regulator [Candidatus Brennerbacteria bacterium]
MKKGKQNSIPSIGNYSSRAAWEAACWRKLAGSHALLDLFTTASERRDIVMRAAALDLLLAGRSYRTIGDELWVSPQTISGIKKGFKEKGYRSYLVRSKTERKKKQYASLYHPRSPRPLGMSRRTKYGTIYIPGI